MPGTTTPIIILELTWNWARCFSCCSCCSLIIFLFVSSGTVRSSNFSCMAFLCNACCIVIFHSMAILSLCPIWNCCACAICSLWLSRSWVNDTPLGAQALLRRERLAIHDLKRKYRAADKANPMTGKDSDSMRERPFFVQSEQNHPRSGHSGSPVQGSSSSWRPDITPDYCRCFQLHNYLLPKCCFSLLSVVASKLIDWRAISIPHNANYWSTTQLRG